MDAMCSDISQARDWMQSRIKQWTEWTGWCLWADSRFEGARYATKGRNAGRWYMRRDEIQNRYEEWCRQNEEDVKKVRNRREGGRKSYETRLRNGGCTNAEWDEMGEHLMSYVGDGVTEEMVAAAMSEYGYLKTCELFDEMLGRRDEAPDLGYLDESWDPFAA